MHPDDIELIRITTEDIAFLKSEWDQDVSDASLRRSSPIFRRLLVEDHLQRCWRHLGLDKQPIIRAVSLEPFLSRIDPARIAYAQAGGAIHQGITVQVPIEVVGYIPPHEARQIFGSSEDSAERDLRLKTFLDSTCVVARGNKISRRTLVKYVANKLGGVHFDPSRNIAKDEEKSFSLLDEIRDQYTACNRAAIYFEFLSIGQAILKSPDVDILLGIGTKVQNSA
jgi:hypothetical protein